MATFPSFSTFTTLMNHRVRFCFGFPGFIHPPLEKMIFANNTESESERSTLTCYPVTDQKILISIKVIKVEVKHKWKKHIEKLRLIVSRGFCSESTIFYHAHHNPRHLIVDRAKHSVYFH